MHAETSTYFTYRKKKYLTYYTDIIKLFLNTAHRQMTNDKIYCCVPCLALLFAHCVI